MKSIIEITENEKQAKMKWKWSEKSWIQYAGKIYSMKMKWNGQKAMKYRENGENE